MQKTIRSLMSINSTFKKINSFEDFYSLFVKIKASLLDNLENIETELSKDEIACIFMIQIMFLWYIQEHQFFNNDKSYLITKFKEYRENKFGKRFNSYQEFLIHFFDKISECNKSILKINESHLGTITILGPSIFIANIEDFNTINIPDEWFYKKSVTKLLTNTSIQSVKAEIPFLNLLECVDWLDEDLTDFLLGDLYERLIISQQRKGSGTYYTPKRITSYICRNTGGTTIRLRYLTGPLPSAKGADLDLLLET